RSGQWDGELVQTRRDGSLVSVSSYWALHRDAEGRVISILEVNVDNTARKKAEDALREAVQQLRLVTDNLTVGVTRCRRDLRYTWVSPSYADWLARNREEFAGQPIAAMVGEEAYEHIAPYIESALTGKRVEYEASVNFSGIGKRWVHAVYVPTRGQEDQVDG